jgi:hypothetical protein
MEKGLKKEKQPWQSQRCFPGCVLEVVCLIRRLKNGKVAQVRKILDLGDILAFYSRLPATQGTSL